MLLPTESRKNAAEFELDWVSLQVLAEKSTKGIDPLRKTWILSMKYGGVFVYQFSCEAVL